MTLTLLGFVIIAPVEGQKYLKPNIILIMTDDQGYAPLGPLHTNGLEQPFLRQ